MYFNDLSIFQTFLDQMMPNYQQQLSGEKEQICLQVHIKNEEEEMTKKNLVVIQASNYVIEETAKNLCNTTVKGEVGEPSTMNPGGNNQPITTK